MEITIEISVMINPKNKYLKSIIRFPYNLTISIKNNNPSKTIGKCSTNGCNLPKERRIGDWISTEKLINNKNNKPIPMQIHTTKGFLNTSSNCRINAIGIFENKNTSIKSITSYHELAHSRCTIPKLIHFYAHGMQHGEI